jgi:hypothetical protein
MVEIRKIELNQIVRQANRHGLEGRKLMGVTFVPPKSGTDTPRWVFHFDNDNNKATSD